MGTPWDALSYDRVSGPQQEWAADVLGRLERLPRDGTVLDVGCGTGRVTEMLLALVPEGRVLAVDASQEMADLAGERLGGRAQVWCQDVLELELRGGGMLEAQCGGEGNIARVREVIDAVAGEREPELVGFSPWEFAGPRETERRLHEAGFSDARCWLTPRPTEPEDPDAFIRT